ncbi:hypothetical protein [Luteolibacter pohnpeiensis]|nr:hypothetical protein [Luteolibacter pohnpeiensis]
MLSPSPASFPPAPPPPLPPSQFGVPAGGHEEASLHPDVIDFLERVKRGERVITIPYVLSILILTLQRSMGGIHYVNSSNWPMGRIIIATIVTSIFGWWGLPFGPIFSLISLYYLWFGGRDQTRTMLKSMVGPVEASRILANAVKPKPTAGIWIIRTIIVLDIYAVVQLFLTIIQGA